MFVGLPSTDEELKHSMKPTIGDSSNIITKTTIHGDNNNVHIINKPLKADEENIVMKKQD